jgi:putative sporulation protein YyaC
MWKDWLSRSRGQRELRVHVDRADAAEQLARHVVTVGQDLWHANREVILLCIGTDRSIGDALGPLVGTMLSERGEWPFQVWGTLEKPVHAGNLADAIDSLQDKHKHATIIALDACLGRVESVGHITVGRGPLRPGAGVGKPLPQIGDLHITGVVNVGEFMEYFVLQNTRLHTVMHMAKTVAEGLAVALGQHLPTLRADWSRYSSYAQIPLPPPGP